MKRKVAVFFFGYASLGFIGLVLAMVALHAYDVQRKKGFDPWNLIPIGRAYVALTGGAFLVPILTYVFGAAVAESPSARNLVAFVAGQIPALNLTTAQTAAPQSVLSFAVGWLVVPWGVIAAFVSCRETAKQQAWVGGRAKVDRVFLVNLAMGALSLLVLYLGVMVPLGPEHPWLDSVVQGGGFALLVKAGFKMPAAFLLMFKHIDPNGINESSSSGRP